MSLGGLFAQWDEPGELRENQVVRVHLGPPAEMWPVQNGFFKGRIKRPEGGPVSRCAVEFLDEPPPSVLVPELVGSHPCIVEVKKALLTLAEHDVNVLLQGESGTGKNVVAALIHRYSARSAAPFVPINIPAIPDTLLESQLFGHEKGAFTDARQSRPGLLRAANRGTVVLDEISSIPLSVQAKLLGAIQDKKFLPVGRDEMVTVDVRLVATTNDNLEGRMREGAFREDLFYRLNETGLVLPPLRERAIDVLILADHFLRRYCWEFGRDYSPIDQDTAERFVKYSWPGNVRELENTIRRGVLLGQFRTADTSRAASAGIDAELLTGDAHSESSSGPPRGIQAAKAATERQGILEALAECRYDRTRTAAHLGVSYRTLLRWLKKHHVQV